jgi:hypothetical protein
LCELAQYLLGRCVSRIGQLDRRVLLELAVGNVAMAAAGVVWLRLGHGFSSAGATLTSLAIAWKMTIGTAQTRSLRLTAVQCPAPRSHGSVVIPPCRRRWKTDPPSPVEN